MTAQHPKQSEQSVDSSIQEGIGGLTFGFFVGRVCLAGWLCVFRASEKRIQRAHGAPGYPVRTLRADWPRIGLCSDPGAIAGVAGVTGSEHGDSTVATGRSGEGAPAVRDSGRKNNWRVQCQPGFGRCGTKRQHLATFHGCKSARAGHNGFTSYYLSLRCDCCSR